MEAVSSQTWENPILVVEDNDDDLELTTRLLRKASTQVRLLTFTDAEQVIAHLESILPQPPEYPHALVLDIKMPRLSGLDILKWVREQPRFDAMPVVMWTSSDDPRDVTRAADLGAQCFIDKHPPANIVEELVAAVGLYRSTQAKPRFFATSGNRFLRRD